MSLTQRDVHDLGERREMAQKIRTDLDELRTRSRGEVPSDLFKRKAGEAAAKAGELDAALAELQRIPEEVRL